jgi:hypothetical protein
MLDTLRCTEYNSGFEQHENNTKRGFLADNHPALLEVLSTSKLLPIEIVFIEIVFIEIVFIETMFFHFPPLLS